MKFSLVNIFEQEAPVAHAPAPPPPPQDVVAANVPNKRKRTDRFVFSDFRIIDRGSRNVVTKREMIEKLNSIYMQEDPATIEIILEIFLNGSDELKRINDVYLKMANDIARLFYIKLHKKPLQSDYGMHAPLTIQTKQAPQDYRNRPSAKAPAYGTY